ncbi:hypothetical protein F4553_000441 [Allocatelliglobosispora scoriae]|uniref:DUF2630 family protein n=1 Tax=Allocatelliglobosispora scoriae TaxID=643052 RepID=A0A841BJW2_9ACTN|nr:DUF2630 family protein [Allocatelliglobosispora scoriae]MBB5867062.1 hypothetical protein [Allocatelliglobosispora scoriae]
MEEQTILHRVSELVAEEHRLRSGVQAGTISAEDEHARLAAVEVELDQCWDLLRRRRAAADSVDTVRPAAEVEGYLQ